MIIFAWILLVILSYFIIGYVSLGMYLHFSKTDKDWDEVTHIFWMWPLAPFMKRKSKEKKDDTND